MAAVHADRLGAQVQLHPDVTRAPALRDQLQDFDSRSVSLPNGELESRGFRREELPSRSEAIRGLRCTWPFKI